ncbi:hypothetical protein ABW21_db0201394 [Orbilia brochopaga]|nr:hypothetical protein ABW21_db0201394 [Drechslerella brochopaga]
MEVSKTLKRPLEPSGWEYCPRCKTLFGDISLSRSHFRTVCQDIYCNICQRIFNKPLDLTEHLHVCHEVGLLNCLRCGFQIEPGEDMTQHWRQTGCHVQCNGCGVWQFQQSIEFHLNENPSCRRTYNNRKVKLEHPEPVIPPPPHPKRNINKTIRARCFGCDQNFEAASSMISHWSAGNCRSHITIQDVLHTFATFPESERYLRSDGRQTLSAFLSYQDLVNPAGAFCCMCSASFRGLTQLINHAESPACGMEFGSNRSGLIRYLETRVYHDSVIRKVNDMKLKIRHTGTFIRSSSPEQYPKFQLVAVIWDCVSTGLRVMIEAVTSQIECLPPGGKRCLKFDNAINVQEWLGKISMELEALRKKFLEYDPEQEISRDLKTAGVVFLQDGSKEARTLHSFLDEVAVFRDIVQHELM